MAQTTFGSIGGAQPSTFGKQSGFTKGQGPSSEGALQGITKFQGSGGAGISKGGTKAMSKTTGTYNKEYGMRLTKEQVQELKASEQDFNQRLQTYSTEVDQKINEAKGKILDEKGRLKSAKESAFKELGGQKKLVEDSWSQLRKQASQNTVEGLYNQWWKSAKKVPLRVMGPDGKPQGNYMVPKSAIPKMQENLSGSGAEFQSNKQGGVDIFARQKGKMAGQEIHDILRTSTSRDAMLKQFNEDKEVHSTIAKNRTAIQKAQNDLKKAEKALAQAETDVRASVANQEGELKGAEFETKELGKHRDREIKGAKQLAGKQKEKRAELYAKWQEARAKAYNALQHMEVK